jgi:Protein of unknown function (DUF4031)
VIYVDDFRVPATIGRHKSRWSHLVTDSPDIEELHVFARRIGLKREWFQEYTKVGHLYRPHYDVTEGKRTDAILAGATPVSVIELVNIYEKLEVFPEGVFCAQVDYRFSVGCGCCFLRVRF